jgi:hypothetical protein
MFFPTQFVLSHSIMDAEAAHVQIKESNQLKKGKHLTLLFDGWECQGTLVVVPT